MLLAGAAAVAVFASAVAGYRFGSGIRPSAPALAATTVAQSNPAQRAVLYWKDPDGKNDFSPEPKKTPDGRDYLPVYEDEEAGFKGEKPAKPQGNRKILYYRNPMGLPDVSPVPKKDSMGMDYIPVYEGEVEDGSTVKILARQTAADRRTLRSGIEADACHVHPRARRGSGR